MFKKIISLSALLIINYTAIFAASSDMGIDCAPQLRSCLNAIQQLPEARKLITNVQKEGPIRIVLTNHSLSRQFGAFWDVDRRIISISPAPHESEGDIIGSIIFELHNASTNSKINHYDHLASIGEIDRDNYVRAIEYLEYENSKKASLMAEKGIKLGLFPKSATLPTYSNFEEHFHYQKIGGHSAWIGKTYDQLAPR